MIVEGLVSSTTATNNLPQLKPYAMKTSLVSLTFDGCAPLDTNSNEWFLWHGSSAAGARGICQQEFKQSKAGSATGTLYGRGTYLTDCITKADEYAKIGE